MRAAALLALALLAGCGRFGYEEVDGTCSGGSCSCAAGQDCDLVCDDPGGCAATCAAGASCSLTCGTIEPCGIECGPGAMCRLGCGLGNGECSISCGAGCSAMCMNGGCVVQP